jgi:lysophospholipase L1-like esterase
MTRLLLGSLLVSFLAVWVIEITVGIYFHIYKAWRLTNATIPSSYQIHGPGNGKLNVLIVGDSIAVGVGASTWEKTVHYQFLSMLNEYKEINVDNFAVSGSLIHDIKKQLMRAGDKRYDLIFISSLANDVTEDTNLEYLRTEIQLALSQSKQIGKNIIWITPASMKTSYAAPYLIRMFWGKRQEAVIKILVDEAIKNEILLVDLVHSRLSENVSKNPHEYYAPDYFHPNDKAYQEAAEIIFQASKASDKMEL